MKTQPFNSKSSINIEIKAKEDCFIPAKAHSSDAGYDLKADIPDSIKIEPGEYKTIGTGVYINLEVGMEAQIRPRSGLASKYGITVLNSPGTIDSGYQGEIKVILINHGKTSYEIKRMDKIAQIVIGSIIETDLNLVQDFGKKTKRGTKGFGSSDPKPET